MKKGDKVGEILTKLYKRFIELAETYEKHPLYPSHRTDAHRMDAIASTYREAAEIVIEFFPAAKPQADMGP